MSQCECLNKGDRILLVEDKDKRKTPIQFTIAEQIGSGGSSICYLAKSDDGALGVLKEFYANDSYALYRNPQRQLVSDDKKYEDESEDFKERRDIYLRSHISLRNALNDSNHKELSAFIPNFRIFHGCDDNGNIVGTVYIWYPKQESVTFETICENIHEHPDQDPEQKLLLVLKAIDHLTQCVLALHSAGFIHRDIKPDNFGFDQLGGEVSPENLWLLDFDSVWSSFNLPDHYIASPGFSEPEHFSANTKTDIYSIGASLFHAIIITDETKQEDYIYKEKFYKELSTLVDNSELIKASEINSNADIRKSLTDILKQCLCRRTARYNDCEELKEDLDKVVRKMEYLMAERSEKDDAGRKDVNTDSDSGSQKNFTLPVLYHLYKHPLYSYADKGPTLNVLLFGLGQYGEQFLDACLQAGQCQEKILNVTVVYGKGAGKEKYLGSRPELKDFFNIDRPAGIDDPDTYGAIKFEEVELNEENMDAFIQSCFSELQLHYVFIALGDENLNLKVAETCQDILQESGRECIVSPAVESELDGHGSIVPVCMDPDKCPDKCKDSEIERMARNTHMIWAKNINQNEIREDLKNEYNHNASVSSVLFLKYRLYSVGIDLDQCGFEKAAREFDENFLKNVTPVGKKKKNELMWREHRRWVTEKLCQGWCVLTDFTKCPPCDTKIKKEQLHVCVVRSTPSQVLKSKSWKPPKWDTATEDELNELDDLDRTSVELHRAFLKKADEIASKPGFNLLAGDNFEEMRNLTKGNKKTQAAFLEWHTCARDIWLDSRQKKRAGEKTNDLRKSKLYDKLREDLISSKKAEGKEEETQRLQERLELFDEDFKYFKASIEYRDLKQEDAGIIDNIPFILTFSDRVCLVIPYAIGNTSDIFKNLASVTMIDPAKVIYLYMADKKEDIDSFLSSIRYVTEYKKKKGLRAKIEFIVACTKNAESYRDNDNKNIEEILGKKGNGITSKVISADEIDDSSYELFPLNDFDYSIGKLTEMFKKYIAKEQKSYKVWMEKNSTPLSWMLLGGSFYVRSPQFVFNDADRTFESIKMCDELRFYREMLKNTNKIPYITVEDMIGLNHSLTLKNDQPEIHNAEVYDRLWAKYKKNRGIWKMLCSRLAEVAEKEKVEFYYINNNHYSYSESSISVPIKYKQKATEIADCLQENNVVKKCEVISPNNRSQKIEVRIKGTGNSIEKFKTVFNKVIKYDPEDILCDPDDQKFIVRYNSMEVNANIKDENNKGDNEKRANQFKDLLEFFEDEGFISELQFDEISWDLSFKYKDKNSKALLTSAGKVLEMYTFYKARAEGCFDDIKSGYEVEWEVFDEMSGAGKEIKSEFDCIITQGFRTLFVECKARNKIKQDFYFKLDSLVRKFGINAKAVVVADTEENNRDNKMEKERGNILDIITVSDPNEIDQIGKTLRKIMTDKYKEK